MTSNIPEPIEKRQTMQVDLLAGLDPSGQPVMEKIRVEVLDNQNLQALHSPLLVRNLARGDEFTMSKAGHGRFSIITRSGYLAVRLFRREDIDELAQWLTPHIEKLDGSCDLSTPNALVYSIHVNTGFNAIETLLDNAVGTFAESVWYYGNVYDPKDGVTPLNWWDIFINQT